MVIYWKNIKCRLGLKNDEVVLDDRYITTKVKSYKDEIKVGLSPSKKNFCYVLDWKPFKNLKFLSQLFAHVGKTAWLEI